MGFEFLLDEHVLIPRPETELLCECLLNKINANSVVYDLCSGSGCIALSLAMLSGARVFAFEKYSGAINILKKNILLHNCSLVSAVECDITERPCFELPEADVIVSNPPYICQKDMLSLQPEVLHEPHTALSGGEDGLVFYRAIAENFTDCLRKGGYAAFEIGEGQAPDVIRIFSSLMHLQTICDYNGIERVLLFRKDY